MLTDDLFTRFKDGTLDKFLSITIDKTLLNNYYVELDGFIADYKQKLFTKPNNSSGINLAINNLTLVRDKVYNRIKELGKNVRW